MNPDEKVLEIEREFENIGYCQTCEDNGIEDDYLPMCSWTAKLCTQAALDMIIEVLAATDMSNEEKIEYYKQVRIDANDL